MFAQECMAINSWVPVWVFNIKLLMELVVATHCLLDVLMCSLKYVSYFEATFMDELAVVPMHDVGLFTIGE